MYRRECSQSRGLAPCFKRSLRLVARGKDLVDDFMGDIEEDSAADPLSPIAEASSQDDWQAALAPTASVAAANALKVRRLPAAGAGVPRQSDSQRQLDLLSAQLVFDSWLALLSLCAGALGQLAILNDVTAHQASRRWL